MSAVNQRRGFTIFEVLLVIGIGTLLLALTLPIGFRFYQQQVADETGESVFSALRNAEYAARLGKHDNAFGVKFFPESYVLFEGSAYATRVIAQDQVFAIPLGATVVSSTNEVVFAEVSGRPNATGTVTTQMYGRTRAFIIESSGVISERY